MESERTAATLPTNISLEPSSYTYYNNNNTLATLLNVEGDFECLGPEKSELVNMPTPQITVSFPEKRKDGNVYFLLETSPNNLRAHRSNKDFIWLRTTLFKLYPGIFIPPLNNKSINSKSNDELIEKRITSYSFFINEVTRNPLLRSSFVVYDFLSIDSSKEFADKQREYNSLQAPSKISEIRTLTGRVNLNGEIFNKDKGKCFDTSRKNARNTKAKLSKLNTTLKTLITNIKHVASTLTELSDIMSSLIKEANTFKNNESTVQTYETLRKLFDNWSLHEKRRALSVELDLRQYVKYVKLEYKAVNEMIDNFEAVRKKYVKEDTKLMRRKEELLKQRDVKNWEFPVEETQIDFNNKEECFKKMLQTQTKSVNDMKMFVCYCGNVFEEEFAQLRQQMKGINETAMVTISNKNEQISKDVTKMWSSIKNVKDKNNNSNNGDNNNNNNKNKIITEP